MLPAPGAADSLPLPVVPGGDVFGLPPAAAPRPGQVAARTDALPGLLPGLPPKPTPPPPPPPSPASPDRPELAGRTPADRALADRHKVLVDRRLLIAGGGILVVLVILFGILAFTGSDSDAATDRPAAAAPARPTAPAGQGQPAAGNPSAVLRSLLNPTMMTGCTAPRRSDSAYADATLNCRTPAGIEVTAFHFPNRSAVDRQIGARETYYYDEGNCDDGQQSSEQWSSSAHRAGGSRLCYIFANRFYEFWTYNDQPVAFSVDDGDAGRLNAWWHTFDPLRH
jgi:hypothetical protein